MYTVSERLGLFDGKKYNHFHHTYYEQANMNKKNKQAVKDRKKLEEVHIKDDKEMQDRWERANGTLGEIVYINLSDDNSDDEEDESYHEPEINDDEYFKFYAHIDKSEKDTGSFLVSTETKKDNLSANKFSARDVIFIDLAALSSSEEDSLYDYEDNPDPVIPRVPFDLERDQNEQIKNNNLSDIFRGSFENIFPIEDQLKQKGKILKRKYETIGLSEDSDTDSVHIVKKRKTGPL